MSGHLAVDRACVETGATADATQRRSELGVGEDLGSAGIDEHNMHLLGAIEFLGLFRAGEDLGVTGQRLTGGRSCQQVQQHRQVVESGNQFLDPHHGDVSLRNRCTEATIAFVGADHHRTTLCDQEIAPGDAQIRFLVLPSQMIPGDSRQLFRFLGIPGAEHLLEGTSDGRSVLVNHRHHDVTRSIVIDLEDELAQIGLHRLDTCGFQLWHQLGLLGDHALGLHAQTNSFLPSDLHHDPVGFLCGGRQMNPGSGRLGPIDPLLQVVI